VLYWLLTHPPGFVWLNSNFKKRYSSKASFQNILRKSKYKKPTFEGRFFVVTCSKSYILRSRRGSVPRCVTFSHTNDELIFEPFLGFFCYFLVILFDNRKDVKRYLVHFITGETITTLIHKPCLKTSAIVWRNFCQKNWRMSSQHNSILQSGTTASGRCSVHP
jgi:hypothetical protein